LGSAPAGLPTGGEIKNADRIFTIAANPKSFKAHLALAQFYFGEKLYPDGETEIQNSIELAPKELLPRFYLAWLYAGMGKVPQAENAYADMKKVAPHDPLAYRALGRFYLASHQEEKALTEFEGLAKSNAGDVTTKKYLARPS
jgi:tetratricopeptide (TPR) repeat protein